MTKRPHVALIVETSIDYGRQILRGVTRYLRSHQTWHVFLEQRELWTAPPTWLRDWRGDGVIARIENARIAAEVIDSGLPCVDLSAAREVPGIPWVETDDSEIARLAFDHLKERGLRHFGFCGAPQFNWSNWRRDAFVRCAKAAGFDVSLFPEPTRPAKHLTHERELEAITAWVKSLPKPCGVMACCRPRGPTPRSRCSKAPRAAACSPAWTETGFSADGTRREPGLS